MRFKIIMTNMMLQLNELIVTALLKEFLESSAGSGQSGVMFVVLKIQQYKTEQCSSVLLLTDHKLSHVPKQCANMLYI